MGANPTRGRAKIFYIYIFSLAKPPFRVTKCHYYDITWPTKARLRSLAPSLTRRIQSRVLRQLKQRHHRLFLTIIFTLQCYPAEKFIWASPVQHW